MKFMRINFMILLKIKKFLNIKIDLNNIFFKIFKPINPIDFDGRKIFKHNLFKKIIYTIKDTNFTKIYNGWLLGRLLIILKEIVVVFLMIIYSPIIFVCYFTKYRFLHINSWQVGAYIQTLDTLVKSNLLKNYRFKLLFIYPKFLKNNLFLSNFYKDHLIIKENFLLYILLYPLVVSRFTSINNWKYETINPNSEFNKIHSEYYRRYKSYILAEDKSIFSEKKFMQLCDELKIDKEKKIISIHQKDDNFYSGSLSRESNIQLLKKTINYLLDNNYFVIRFTSKVSKKIEFKKKSYLEVVISSEEDKSTQYIILKKSNLVICHQGGIHSYNQIIDVPFLQINSIPININPTIKEKDMVILKKFFSKKDNKKMNIKDILENNFHLYTDNRTLKEKGIELIENDEDEIFNAMIDILNNQNKSISDKFKQNFPDYVSFKYSNSCLSPSFLEKNYYLINK